MKTLIARAALLGAMLLLAAPQAATAAVTSSLPGGAKEPEPYVFVVEHADAPALFRAEITVAPRVTVNKNALYYDADGKSTHADTVSMELEWWTGSDDAARKVDGMTAKVLDHVRPQGLGVVGWEIDLMPLPKYPEQAVTGFRAVFDNGAVLTEKGYQGYTVRVPDGAKRLERVEVMFEWNDYDRVISFDMHGGDASGIERGWVLLGLTGGLLASVKAGLFDAVRRRLRLPSPLRLRPTGRTSRPSAP